ncbi:MAG: sodium:solute symporter, partial [Planctomycetota bacterium]|nr:sodium:solute symporter [Planctomycetota bacterium]
LAAMVAFGVWIGRRQRSSADFMVGGRDFPWWVILFSIVATETSTVSFLSVPGIAWGSDLTFLQLPIGYIVGRLLVVSLLMPRFFRGQMFTAYEVLNERFGGWVRRVASLLFIVTRTLGDGLRLFLSAIVLWKVVGIEMEYAVACLGIATICYTFMGGMRAVLWTDAVQFVVYMVGAGIALVVLLGQIDGGLTAALDLAEVEGKLQCLDFQFDLVTPYLFWTGLFGGAVFAIGTHGVDQMMVQRYLCARNQRDASLALGLSGPVVLLQFGFFLLIGTALYAFYAQHPPGAAFGPKDGDKVFASFIVDHLPVGVLGIVLGAVFSAAMSTLSSSLNSTATALVNDVYMPPERRDVDDAARLRAVRLCTVLFGLAQIGVGICGRYLDESVIGSVLGIQSFTTGIILGVFFLGIFTRRVDQRAALLGLLAGLLVMTSIKFGTPLAWPWFALFGSTATFVFGILASVLLPRNRSSTR